MGKWVHFEIFYRKAADATGRITIWQDGVQILDHANVATAPTDLLQWDVGGGSNDIAPSPATVYFDDATISLTRAWDNTGRVTAHRLKVSARIPICRKLDQMRPQRPALPIAAAIALA